MTRCWASVDCVHNDPEVQAVDCGTHTGLIVGDVQFHFRDVESLLRTAQAIKEAANALTIKAADLDEVLPGVSR